LTDTIVTGESVVFYRKSK